MMIGLVLGIVVMVILVSKTKVHTFIALLAAFWKNQAQPCGWRTPLSRQ
nr:hypothetical protein [uncultured Schaedlerella sp.]